MSVSSNAVTLDTDVVDSAEIATNAVKADELDVSDVSDNIAADIAEGELADNIIVSADIKNGEVDFSDDTNATAGRSLTLTDDSIAADAELYTDTKCVYFYGEPGTDDDLYSVFPADGTDYTMTRLWCESDGGVYIMMQLDDGTPASADSVAMLCDSTAASDAVLDGDTGFADGEELDLIIQKISEIGATYFNFCFTVTKDD